MQIWSLAGLKNKLMVEWQSTENTYFIVNTTIENKDYVMYSVF